MIKFGDIEYFRLLDLRDRLCYKGLDSLELSNLDKLRTEIDIKIKRIELRAKQESENGNKTTSKQTQKDTEETPEGDIASTVAIQKNNS